MYLKDADLLIANNSSESAVSRAYYAMYYMAKALLFFVDINVKTHQGTVMMFGKHFIKNGIFEKKYNNILTKALNQRIVGDYEIGKGIELDLATEIVNEAHEFVTVVIKYLKTKYKTA
ncbi:MAG: HEPN domain-containing protein [Bacteroidetes bacterium]|nr:MAG: HEPN domain-containing protein [Bacteroidota bacterium]